MLGFIYDIHLHVLHFILLFSLFLFIFVYKILIYCSRFPVRYVITFFPKDTWQKRLQVH